MRESLDNETGERHTTMNLTISKQDLEISLNITHIVKEISCFTATRRPSVISHKCYGGGAEGHMTGQAFSTIDNQTKMVAFNMDRELTRTLFDGFRGSGMYWNWTWATGLGFSQKTYQETNQNLPSSSSLGLNFGVLKRQAEDFIFYNGKPIAVEGLKYEINSNLTLGESFTFTYLLYNEVLKNQKWNLS